MITPVKQSTNYHKFVFHLQYYFFWGARWSQINAPGDPYKPYAGTLRGYEALYAIGIIAAIPAFLGIIIKLMFIYKQIIDKI